MTDQSERDRLNKINPGGQAGSTNFGQNPGDAGIDRDNALKRKGKKDESDQPGADSERTAGAEEDTYD